MIGENLIKDHETGGVWNEATSQLKRKMQIGDDKSCYELIVIV